jgi:mersacidin/lichenicidin family type 2 lantibiotic
MSVENIIRAWKDEHFRNSLSDAERALLPENPAGVIDLTAAELDVVEGGAPPWTGSNCAPCG